MKKLLYILFTFVLLFSCKKNELKLAIDTSDQSRFTGIFVTRDSDNLRGTIVLKISDGYYQCSTNLPYGQGAGKLEADNSLINFVDTLFLPRPAIFGPSYVLSGVHSYEFDGKSLRIWKEKNVGSVHYELKLAK